LPLIPVTIRHNQQQADVLALIDSGAEHSVFPLAIAEELGWDLSNQVDVTIAGIAGAQAPGKLALMQCAIGRVKWSGPVIFSSGVHDRPLLGQAGFFEFFTVTFRRRRRDIEIKRARSLSSQTP
jgi:hypothetical protein